MRCRCWLLCTTFCHPCSKVVPFFFLTHKICRKYVWNSASPYTKSVKINWQLWFECPFSRCGNQSKCSKRILGGIIARSALETAILCVSCVVSSAVVVYQCAWMWCLYGAECSHFVHGRKNCLYFIVARDANHKWTCAACLLYGVFNEKLSKKDRE